MKLELLKKIALSDKYAMRLNEAEYRSLIDEAIAKIKKIDNEEDQSKKFRELLMMEPLIIDEEDIDMILEDYDSENKKIQF